MRVVTYCLRTQTQHTPPLSKFCTAYPMHYPYLFHWRGLWIIRSLLTFAKDIIMLNSISTFVGTTFRTATTAVTAVENLANAAEKQTRRLDVLSAAALEAEVSQLEESKALALQKRKLLNHRLEQDLKREMESLGISVV